VINMAVCRFPGQDKLNSPLSVGLLLLLLLLLQTDSWRVTLCRWRSVETLITTQVNHI